MTIKVEDFISFTIILTELLKNKYVFANPDSMKHNFMFTNTHVCYIRVYNEFSFTVCNWKGNEQDVDLYNANDNIEQILAKIRVGHKRSNVLRKINQNKVLLLRN